MQQPYQNRQKAVRNEGGIGRRRSKGIKLRKIDREIDRERDRDRKERVPKWVRERYRER